LKIFFGLFLGLYFLIQAIPALPAQRVVSSVLVPPIVPPVIEDENTIQTEALRSGRGSFRSPRSGFTGGTRRPSANEPVSRTPAAPTSRFGGFFGGMLAGTFIGSLLNPFGFGGTGGLSIIGLLFWGLIIYLTFRVLRMLFGRVR
jgi:predicted lipid-binding transport protein (Tim44 family)